MKFWIEKQNPLKIWKHHFPIFNDMNLSLNYYSNSDGRCIIIEDTKTKLAEFDLNGRINLSERTFGKFSNGITLPSNIRQRIIIKNQKIDFVKIITPARNIHLDADINKWKKAIANAVLYEVKINETKVAEIIHNSGLNLKENKLIEADLFIDQWFDVVLIHCVNMIEDLKVIGAGE